MPKLKFTNAKGLVQNTGGGDVDLSGEGVLFGNLIRVEALTVAKTLTPGDSGKCFTLNSAGGAYSITLPTSLTSGLNYKLTVIEHTPTGAITIAAGSAIMFGKVVETEVDTSDDGPGSSANTGISNLIIGTSGHRGDHVVIWSDGTSWYFNAQSAADGVFTTS